MPFNCINVLVLSNNCPKCKTLEKMVAQTLTTLNVNANIEVVSDLEKIKLYGVTHIPSIVINNNIVFEGELPSLTELKEIIIKQCNVDFQKPIVSSHQEQIAIYCKALSDPLNIFILERIRNSKSCCTNSEIFNDLQITRPVIIEHLKELKCSGLITGNIEPTMKFCINKINWGIAKILFTNLFK